MIALWQFLAYGALISWIVVLLDRGRSWPGGQFLSPPDSFRGESGPEVVAVVPARDEADVLPRTLPALLRQDHPFFRVILVDDRSDDGTAACARQIARDMGSPERLQVVQGSPPPPGWQGKVHAQATALAALGRERGPSPEWILLTDADILHPPDSIRALLLEAANGGRDLVSVMARLHAGGFWERLLIPPFVFFFHLLYPFRRVSRPGSRLAAAAGGCTLIRWETLLEAGGFETIRGEIIDDVALARAVRSTGGNIWLGLCPRVTSVRSYPRLRDVWQMVARTAFVQLRCSWVLLLLTVLALLALLVAPPILAGALLLLQQPAAALAALVAWLLPSTMLLPYTRYHAVAGIHALLLPAASFLYLLMTLSSAWEHLRGRGPAWKGRRYAPAAAGARASGDGNARSGLP